MTHWVLVNFLDPHLGKCSASVATVEGDVAVVLLVGDKPKVALRMPGLNAVQLARAILSAAGEKGSLPQSRQIGGIIGPY